MQLCLRNVVVLVVLGYLALGLHGRARRRAEKRHCFGIKASKDGHLGADAANGLDNAAASSCPSARDAHLTGYRAPNAVKLFALESDNSEHKLRHKNNKLNLVKVMPAIAESPPRPPTTSSLRLIANYSRDVWVEPADCSRDALSDCTFLEKFQTREIMILYDSHRKHDGRLQGASYHWSFPGT
ncbi:hypothetical protein BDZ89DRAFT_1055035 [Hymenopellis radicata]|nr:hypothetical protein BDZ89DRAFT_1055035 [Hymenopellis radicata]